VLCSVVNQNYSKILECDWLSPAQFEHQLGHVHRVCTSCLLWDSVIGQLTRHACVCTCTWTEIASCAHAVIEQFAKLTITIIFLFYENVLPMSSFLINWYQDFMSSNSVYIHTHD